MSVIGALNTQITTLDTEIGRLLAAIPTGNRVGSVRAKIPLPTS